MSMRTSSDTQIRCFCARVPAELSAGAFGRPRLPPSGLRDCDAPATCPPDGQHPAATAEYVVCIWSSSRSAASSPSTACSGVVGLLLASRSDCAGAIEVRLKVTPLVDPSPARVSLSRVARDTGSHTIRPVSSLLCPQLLTALGAIWNGGSSCTSRAGGSSTLPRYAGK